MVGYLPSKDTAVVAFTTMSRIADPTVAYASAIANRIAKLVDPQNPPDFPVCPRPPC